MIVIPGITSTQKITGLNIIPRSPLKAIQKVYPYNLSSKIQEATESLNARWKINFDIYQKNMKKLEAKKIEAEEKAAFEALPPLEKAMQYWLEKDCTLDILYTPEHPKIKETGVDSKEFQEAMLRHLQRNWKEKCKQWKKTACQGPGQSKKEGRSLG